jgi:GDP-D-mannose 3',5'-epimerase
MSIDDCLEAALRSTWSDFAGPFNIGSEEMVTINQLVEMVPDIAGKRTKKNHVAGPLGVRGGDSDNRLIPEEPTWQPRAPLRDGLEVIYRWVERQVAISRVNLGAKPIIGTY